MNKFEKKLYKIIGSLFIIVFFLIGYAVQSQEDRQYLEVVFLDVGQGDAILIKTPYEQNILIDGGPGNAVLSQLGRNLAFFDKEIDLVVLTHPHSDHVSGLVEVLRRYQVKKVLMTGVLHTAPDYLTFLDEINQQNIEIEIANAQKDIVFGENLKLQLLYPWTDLSGQKVEELNNSSIVAKLIYQDTSFLFTGDAEAEIEQELIDSGIDLTSDILKLGHHGSKSSSIIEFLKKVNPQYAVAQVGEDNNFGHPHYRTMTSLNELGLKFLRTDQLGTIKFISDGNNIWQN
jgi:competence protein ComEC